MKNCGGAFILFSTASNVLLHGHLGPDFQLANAINPPATNRGRGWQRDVKGARKEELVGRIWILFATKFWYFLGNRAKILCSQRKDGSNTKADWGRRIPASRLSLQANITFLIVTKTYCLAPWQYPLYPSLVSRSHIYLQDSQSRLGTGELLLTNQKASQSDHRSPFYWCCEVRLNLSCGSCQCGRYQILSLESRGVQMV